LLTGGCAIYPHYQSESSRGSRPDSGSRVFQYDRRCRFDTEPSSRLQEHGGVGFPRQRQCDCIVSVDAHVEEARDSGSIEYLAAVPARCNERCRNVIRPQSAQKRGGVREDPNPLLRECTLKKFLFSRGEPING
jgi:hypothetical protein